MKTRIFDPTRREVLAGLGAGLGASVAGLMAGGAVPAVTAQLALQARPATLALRPGQPATPIWELAAVSHLGVGRGQPPGGGPSQTWRPLRGGLPQRPACAACTSLVRPWRPGRGRPASRT